MKIGAALASFLRERGTNAAEVCRLTGIKPASMSKYISDKTEPSYTTLKTIADTIGVKACEIIARAEGIALKIDQEASPQESEIVRCYRAMEPDAKGIYTALAQKLTSK